MRVRGLQQGDQSRLGFGLRQCAQLPQGFVVAEMGDVRARVFGVLVHRRVVRPQAKCGVQRPLVGFGRGVELVERRGERQRCAAGVFAHEHRAVRPVERRAHAGDVAAPALQGAGIERYLGRDLQRRAGSVEIQVGAGQPARVLERFAHVMPALNPILRARSAGRVRRGPRLPSPPPAVRPGWFPALALRRAARPSACRRPA